MARHRNTTEGLGLLAAWVGAMALAFWLGFHGVEL